MIFQKVNTLFLFFIIFLLIFSSNLFADISDGISPTPPPRLPITDYKENSESIVDFDYLRYSDDDISFNGYGVGYNFIKPIGEEQKYAYNIGFGGVYLSGETDSGTSAGGGSIPINGNFAYRMRGTADSSNIVLIGGLHFTYSHIEIDTSQYIEIDVWQWGPLIGIKSTMIANSTKIIPFYILRYDIMYIDVYVGDNYTYVEDDMLSHIIGFDIEFETVSIGSMLDLFNSQSRNLISIHAAFTF